MKTTAIIMAGGKGQRFWPKSRANLPKQFLCLTGDGRTMLQRTVNRFLTMIPWEDIYIVTNKNYINLVSEQLPELPIENILLEPIAKNTAPCIGFAAAVITKKYGDAVMVVLPSDHLIKMERIYKNVIAHGIEIAQNSESLVTIGITPSSPETAYGYINFDQEREHDKFTGVYGVRKFVEKPDLKTAEKYLDSGEYLWNSGMFVLKASTIINQIKSLIPDMYSGLIKIKNAFASVEYEKVLESEFSKFENVSIDYGIMEKSKNIFTIPANFGWDDVGNWTSLENFNKTDENGNVIQGDIITVDTDHSVVIGNKKLIATVGIEDLVIVDSDDALLICNKNSAQNIKKILEILESSGKNQFL